MRRRAAGNLCANALRLRVVPAVPWVPVEAVEPKLDGPARHNRHNRSDIGEHSFTQLTGWSRKVL